jgi:hypothetical protein
MLERSNHGIHPSQHALLEALDPLIMFAGHPQSIYALLSDIIECKLARIKVGPCSKEEQNFHLLFHDEGIAALILRIDKDGGKCQLYVFGKPGSTSSIDLFRLIRKHFRNETISWSGKLWRRFSIWMFSSPRSHSREAVLKHFESICGQELSSLTDVEILRSHLK